MDCFCSNIVTDCARDPVEGTIPRNEAIDIARLSKQ